MQSLKISDGNQIVYHGCVGTCTPFVELLAIAIRNLHAEQVFVPLLDESKARKIVNVDNVGLQVCGDTISLIQMSLSSWAGSPCLIYR
jgi:hypothetical protein